MKMVPATGLEPARLAAYAPKAYVYTNFTTRAWGHFNIIIEILEYGKFLWYNVLMDISVVGISTLVVFAIGCIMHFAYAWSHENKFVAVFAATNESVWEHVKIGLTGLFLLTLYDFFQYGDMHNYWIAKGFALMSFVIIVPSVFYAFWKSVPKKLEIVVDVIEFFVDIFFTQIIFFAILNGPKLQEWLFYPAFIFLFLVLGAYVMFTWVQPRVHMFMDVRNGKYGLKAYQKHSHAVRKEVKKAEKAELKKVNEKKAVVEKRIEAARKAPAVGKSVAKKRVVKSIDGMKKVI